jgi:hypothetical protein
MYFDWHEYGGLHDKLDEPGLRGYDGDFPSSEPRPGKEKRSTMHPGPNLIENIGPDKLHPK